MKDLQERIWKRKASKKIYVRGVLRIDKALSLLPHGDKLLDIGCGDGALTISNFKETHGLDISHKAVTLAKSKGMKAKTHDINKPLPYNNSYFDAITCLDVIDYVENPKHLVKEMERILKQNGILIISYPNIRNWRNIISILKGNFPKTSGDQEGWDGGHIHYFTSKDISNLLKNKFNIKIHGLFSSYTVKHKIFRLLGKKFLREFAADGIMIKAVKK